MWHVLPDDDWIGHEPSDKCVCGPLFEIVDGVELMVHQTIDDRKEEAG